MKSIRTARRFAKLLFGLLLVTLVSLEVCGTLACRAGLNQALAAAPASTSGSPVGVDAMFAAMR